MPFQKFKQIALTINGSFIMKNTINGQLNNGKKVALGLKLSGGVAAAAQNFLKFNFKGMRPDLSLTAAPSVALMLGSGKYIGCQLDLAYLGSAGSVSEGLKKGFFMTPRFSFQF